MKKIILTLTILVLPVLLAAQNYTWERYNVPYTGGHQSAGNYSSYTSSEGFKSGTVSNAGHSGYTGFLYPKLDVRLPEIDTIVDVPDDQGKWVQIIWAKCGYDEFYVQDNFYTLWRDDEDTGNKNFTYTNIYEVIESAKEFPGNKWYWNKDGIIWTYIDTIPALTYDEYSYIAPTLKDSIAPDILNYSSFKVVFHDLYAYFESEPDSGYSMDNLAPFVPALDGEFLVSNIILEWDESLAEDFQYFAIYKSNDPFNFPTEPYAMTIDTSYQDYDLNADSVFYYVTAFDYNGNESEQSNILSFETLLRVDIKVFLEGPFSGTEMTTNLNSSGHLPLSQPYYIPPWNYSGIENVDSIPNSEIVDWILVELRDAPDAASAISSTVMSRQAAFLLKNGTVVGTDGVSMLNFANEADEKLFVNIWHRNHLGIMAANELTYTDNKLPYDFPLAESQVYGGVAGYNQIGTGVWGMVSGDGNTDGIINSGDKIASWTIETGLSGYLQSDFNLDGQTDNPDKNDIWLNNNGKESQVPD